MTKATGKIQVADHINNCPALKTATRGRGTPSQRSPWFFNQKQIGTRSGPAARGYFIWFEFRCRDISCKGILQLREDYMLSRTLGWKFSA